MHAWLMSHDIQLGQIPSQWPTVGCLFTEMCWCALCPSRLPVAWYECNRRSTSVGHD